MTAPALDLPRIDGGRSAATVAGALVDLYARIDPLPHKVSWVLHATGRRLAGDADPALAAAARSIAHAIDADGERHDRQPYHGRQHFCEVMLAASVLAELHRLPARPTQLLLLAALIHDLGHDGRPAPSFRLERGSIACAMPHLVDAGVDATTRLRLTALVLATEPHHGVRSARQARDVHASRTAPPTPTGMPAELRLLGEDEELARLAMLLCEADLLPSTGLTSAHALHLQHRLAQECGRALGPQDKLAFLDAVLAAGVIGPFFRPNVSAIRQELAQRIDATP